MFLIKPGWSVSTNHRAAKVQRHQTESQHHFVSKLILVYFNNKHTSDRQTNQYCKILLFSFFLKCPVEKRKVSAILQLVWLTIWTSWAEHSHTREVELSFHFRSATFEFKISPVGAEILQLGVGNWQSFSFWDHLPLEVIFIWNICKVWFSHIRISLKFRRYCNLKLGIGNI